MPRLVKTSKPTDPAPSTSKKTTAKTTVLNVFEGFGFLELLLLETAFELALREFVAAVLPVWLFAGWVLAPGVLAAGWALAAGFLVGGFLAAEFSGDGFLADGLSAAGFLAAGFLVVGLSATGFLTAGLLTAGWALAAGLPAASLLFWRKAASFLPRPLDFLTAPDASLLPVEAAWFPKAKGR